MAQSVVRVRTPDSKAIGREWRARFFPASRGQSGIRISSRCGSARRICFPNTTGKSFPTSSTSGVSWCKLLNSEGSLSLTHCATIGKPLEGGPVGFYNSVAMRLILASVSPRREELLRNAGFDFEVCPSGVDEGEPGPGELPEQYARRNACAKAMRVAADSPAGSIVLGADTVVTLSGHILGKPSSPHDATRML